MTKQDLIQQIAEEEGIPESEARVIVEELLRLIRNRMLQGKETQIYGFGNFGVRWWKGRTGRDPQTGEEIEIEGRWVPYWTPSDTLTEEGKPHPKSEETAGEGVAAESEELHEDMEEHETEPAEEEEGPAEKQDDAWDFNIRSGAVFTPELKEEEGEPSGPAHTDDQETDKQEEDLGGIREEEAADDQELTIDWTPPGSKRRRNRWVLGAVAVVAVAVIGWLLLSPSTPEETASSRTNEQPVTEAPADVKGTGAENREDLAETEEPGSSAGSAGEGGSPEISSSPEGEMEISSSRIPIRPVDVQPYKFSDSGHNEFTEIYNEALDVFQSGQHAAAEKMFRRLRISDIPREYTDNVQYWLGECEFAKGNYQAAVRAFERVFVYPGTNKVEDALIMIAYSYLHMADYARAKTYLMKFRTQYPDSRYSEIADRWLQEYNLVSS